MTTHRMVLALAAAALALVPVLDALAAQATATDPLSDLFEPKPAHHEDTSWAKLAERTNFDGSKWVVYGFSYLGVPLPDARGLAVSLAEAGVHAYDQQVLRNPVCGSHDNPAPNWGFESKDPDCVLEVYLLTHPLHVSTTRGHDYLTCLAACIHHGADVKVMVQPWAKELFLASANNVDPFVNDQDGFARALMGHENFHNLQYQLSAWDPYWAAYIEGQAAFQETVVAAPQSADPTSSWYARGRQYQQSAVHGLCKSIDAPAPASDRARDYDLGLYWGYLYWKDGGFGLIHDALDAMAGVRGLSCDVGLPQAITTALAANPGLHDTHEAALVDFALHAYTKEFTWGGPGQTARDWGEHLDDPLFEVQATGTLTRAVGPSGLQYVKLPTQGTYAVDCAAGSGWTFRLFLKDAAGAVTTQPVTCGAPVAVDGSLHADVVFSAVRTATTEGSYALTVT